MDKMTLDQADMLLDRLGANWPKAQLSDEKRVQYIACIADLPFEVGELVVTHALTTRTWFPEISEFRRIVVELQHAASGRPTADAAWQEFKAAVHRFGYAGVPTWSHPAVKATADRLGFRDYCLSDTGEEPSWRARFMAVYEAIGEQEVREVQMLPSVRRGLAQLADHMSAWRLSLPAVSSAPPRLGDVEEPLGEGWGEV
jgi:hypothetical protein